MADSQDFLRTDVAGSIIFCSGGKELEWRLPEFPLGGRYVSPATPPLTSETESSTFYDYVMSNGVTLRVEARLYAGFPFCRLRFRLAGEGFFTSVDRDMPIHYGETVGICECLTEVRLSDFDRINHSFKPVVTHYDDGAQYGRTFIGPIVVARYKDQAVMLAYEHGAEAPDHFLCFESSEESLSLRSAKGNYFRGQRYEDYESPWLMLGIGDSEEEIRKAYRRFLLESLAPDPASRKPYIFYNTWNNQERDKYFLHKPYLSAMRQEHMLKEIDAAHDLGIEYFVLDTGWFQKTGDWEVNIERFPDGLRAIREKLSAYGMKLGVWLNPVVAARSSRVRLEHKEWTLEKGGVESYWGRIWETEESYGMCLVSDYADYFVELMVRLHEELGVDYFKWDAIDQYGCDCPRHRHGTTENTPQERLDSYAYQMGLNMIRIAGETARRCPGVIVDFDVTEGRRFVGLGFLSVGKYFLVNNGPYFSSFDIPSEVHMEPNTINVFFYPGAARPQVCRVSSQFDTWIPSSLFLTHFLPEGSARDRNNSKSSLVLGGNGIWGDLLGLTEEEKADWSSFLAAYKLVREDALRADPIVYGWIGSSPEVHEKVYSETGRGFISFFCRRGGTFTHITRRMEAPPRKVIGADKWVPRDDKRLEITVSLEDNDAKTVFLL